jgi:hypothetical protein
VPVEDVVQQILKPYRELVSQRAPWETDWRDCATYIQPRKLGAIGKPATPGEKLTTRLFDSTAIHANGLLGASLQGSLTSPAMRWFKLRMRNDDLNRVQAVQEWLDLCGARVYSALQQSNWNAETFEAYLDLGAFGTAAVFMVERDDEGAPGPGFRGMLFKAIPIGTYVIAEDAEGRVDTLGYTFSLPAIVVLERFGATACGERLGTMAKEKPQTPVELLHWIAPRRGGAYGGKKLDKPWKSCYVSEKDKRLLEEGGYDMAPFAVPRWTKASGETYGRGPGHTALPDIRTLNRMTELELRAIAKAIEPPLLARHHGVIGAVRTTPGAITTVRDDPRTALIPLESGAKFQVGQIKSEQLKNAIRDMFYNGQLQLPSNQPMTATETERRYELMNRVLGPTLGRLEYEHTNPTVMRTFALMFQAGALPPPPSEVLEAAQLGEDHLDVVSEGPLARAQKGSDVLAWERTFAVTLPIAQVDPSAMDVYKLDEVVRMVGEASGVPARAFRSEIEIAEMRAQRQAQLEQTQKMDTMERLATSAGKAAPALAAVSGAAKTGQEMAQARNGQAMPEAA